MCDIEMIPSKPSQTMSAYDKAMDQAAGNIITR